MAVNLGTLYVMLEARTAALQKGQQEVTRAAQRMERDLNKVRDSARLLTGALAGVVSIRTAQAIFQQADAYNVLQQRLQTATAATGDYARVQAELMNQAQATGTALDATVALFQRVALGARELGASTEQILQFTKTVQQLGVMSGASNEALRSGLIQLSQAMTSGVVRAEEMNSILENIPEVANAIARAMGTTAGELRKMVVEGEVASSQVFQAILSQAERINGEFAKLAPALGRAMQGLKNEFGRVMSQSLDTGAMSGAITAVQELTENLETVIRVATVAGGTLASVYAAKGLGAVTNAAVAAATAQVKQIQSTMAAQRATVTATAADVKAAKEKAALTAARLREAKIIADTGVVETAAAQRTTNAAQRDIARAQAILVKSRAKEVERRTTLAAAEAEVYAATQAATQGYGAMRKVEQATRARDRALKALNVELTKQAAQETRIALAEAQA
ncbi:MAG TPA: tape measure protein, partial [Candidatus Sumerlaeota bacterium]|nr:tape measure protein [Candidatus Sumerlaeota bacterium]